MPNAMFSEDCSLRAGPVRCAWRDYHRGQAAESLVRPWLALELDRPDAALDLTRDPRGRPALRIDGRPPGAAPDVNWSHSGGLLLAALGDGVRVGVDVEWLRPRPQAMALARRFFTPGEAAALARMAPAAAEAAFVRLWCAKEAVLKAHGHGLSFGLDRLEFTARDDAWMLSACDPALGLPDDWSLYAFSPRPDYLATLAWRPRAHAPPTPAVRPVD
ncbi:4'-phosphopantetheinyl transferase family protein [Luteimonas deserti]|uniref:4'-phosphopantetheinyl transferase superfamily protein n=1 Tax=Luteimonas deserti TaxID=2752306 RepID=A0A7Z0QT70_9GAMM|nr:4'-phosphopantetheinyl transferase superfamily protein [Luteimonas deserti]NYZ63496.1 4'-phosphopantetheinyl transferase superfamily protein [Luteimonas deserti]